MGDRRVAEIRTQHGSIYFYAHWGGQELPAIARAAVEAAKPRLGQESYWTRRVIDSLIAGVGSRDCETGSGISLKPEFEDEYGDPPSIVIDATTGLVTVKGRP